MRSYFESPGEHVAALGEIATRDVRQLDAGRSLGEAVAIMAEHGISSLVVTDGDNRPSGVLTEQNIILAMQRELPPDSHLRDVMSTPIITVPLDMESRDAYMLCLREGIRHLVLVDGQGLVAGVVSETDFRLHLSLTTLTGHRTASSVMSRSVLSLPPEANLRDALALMQQQREDCLVVVEAHRPVGIITERDVVRLYCQVKGQAAPVLQAAMSSPVVTVLRDAPLSDVAQRMLGAGLRHLVVVDRNGLLAGMISEHDLTQLMAFGMVESQAYADRTFLRTLLDAIPDLIWLKDPNGVYLACNAPFGQIHGAEEKEIIGRTDFEFLPRESAEQLRAQDLCTVNADKAVRSEEWLEFPGNGYSGLFETINTPVKDQGGHLTGVLGIARDITDRKRAEAALEESTALLNAVVDSTANLIWSVDAESFSVLTFNAGLRDHFSKNYGITLAYGMPIDEMLPTEEMVLIWRGFYQRALREGRYSIEYLTTAGAVYLQLTFNLLYREGRIFGIAIFGEDITERKASEAHIQYLAYHDTLTELPNRALATERFQLAKSFATRSNEKIALLLLDIDDFKAINDALGHQIGDRLLKAVADRLRVCVRNADTISRLGGDEFLVLLTDIRDPDHIAETASKLLTTLPELVNIEEYSLSVTASIGIAIYPDDAEDMDGLMKKADAALFVVKGAGRNDFRFSDSRFNSATVEALSIRNELRMAVERNEFELHYQPQVDLYSGRLIGAEALIRWNSPARGLVPPSVFIPVAEESGLIIPIGAWVLKEACRQAVEWRHLGFGDNLFIAVNLSAIQFTRGDIEASVMEALESSGLEPQALELELTESILVKDPEQVLTTLQRLKGLGIRLSIDDFGTGYSSLSYLQRFPIDKLKIDQSFVRDMATDAGDAALVRAIIQMARAMGLRTIAEGIEDETTAKQLRIHHCDEGQGYYFARPMTAESFAGFAG